MESIYSIIVFLLQNVAMADGLRSEGKIYIVVLVLLIILFALFFYLLRIDKKIDFSKMTKIVSGKKLWNYDNLEPTEKKGAI